MEVQKQPKLTFLGVDFLNVNFNAFSPRKKEMEIDIECIPKVFFPKDNNNLFKIVMDLSLKEENCFELTLRAAGSFELDTELTPELRKTFVNSNAPAIMFPYIRAFVATLTANLGFVTGTLTIPTQFFKGNIEEIVD